MNTQLNLARAAACLLLAAAGAHAHAQQAIQAAADPQASVPATRYQSALGKGAEPAPDTSPDANWVASNRTVAATDSMALTMKPMSGQAADPHAGHAGMQGMHGMGMGINMDKKDAPAMCAPGSGSEGMQCMSGDKAGGGKMSCCQSCCKDKMKKDKEAP